MVMDNITGYKPQTVSAGPPMKSELDIAIDMLYEHVDPEKREYLSYRYCGYTKAESAKMIGRDVLEITGWYLNDKGFKDVDSYIGKNQDRVALRREVFRHIFSRNMRKALEHDGMVLDYAMELWKNGEQGKIPKEVASYITAIRKFYTASEMVTIEKLLAQDNGAEFNIVQLVQNVNNYHSSGQVLPK